jgi:3-phytase
MKFLLLLLFAVSTMAQTAPLEPIAKTIDGRNVDSLAVWIAPKKSDSLVLLTEKEGGQVMVFKADKNATFVRRFGEMKRPNAVVVVHKAKLGKRKLDLVFVTERDANKVSVFSAPNFEKLGEFAHDVQQPMGISLYQRGKNDLVAFIVPKRAEGNDKVLRYKITEENGKIIGIREKEFGKEITPEQETVYVDAKTKLVYVADENARNIKIYDVDGNLQKTIGDGIFQAQVEGIAIAECKGKRYLIASDQLPVTEFEIFELPNFEHRGTVVTSARITDGIALTTQKLPDFPKGLFLAQTDPSDTGGLRAEFFDLNGIFGKVNIKCR